MLYAMEKSLYEHIFQHREIETNYFFIFFVVCCWLMVAQIPSRLNILNIDMNTTNQRTGEFWLTSSTVLPSETSRQKRGVNFATETQFIILKSNLMKKRFFGIFFDVLRFRFRTCSRSGIVKYFR